MRQKLFYLTIFLATLGILISQIMFVPTWEYRHAIFIISVFLFSAISGIIHLVKTGGFNHKNKQSLKVIDWIKSISISIVLIVGIPLLFILSIFTSGQGFLGPTLIKEITLDDETIYLYHLESFVPDSSCECEYYSSHIYKKNTLLPTMHLLTKVDFYVDEIQLNKNELAISASNRCSKDINKIKKIKLYISQ